MTADRPRPPSPGDDSLVEWARAHAVTTPTPPGTLTSPVGEAAELLEGYRAVDAVLRDAETAAEAAAGPCRVRFEDVEARIAHDAPRSGSKRATTHASFRTWTRPLAAAVLLAGAIAGAALVARRLPESEPPSVVPVAAPADPTQEDDPAAVAAALRVAGAIAETPDETPLWFSDLAVARDAARATGRPLLLFVQHPTCPICEELEAGPLRDDGVRSRLGSFVAVRVGAFDAIDDPILDRDWPCLWAFTPDGTEIAGLPAPCTAAEIRDLLDRARARSPATRDGPSWKRLREIASRLARADAAHEEGLADVERDLLREVATMPDGGAFAAAARRRLAAPTRDAGPGAASGEGTEKR